MSTDDPTSDLTDDDVRRVCDEADAKHGIPAFAENQDGIGFLRMLVADALHYDRDRDPWDDSCCAAVARLRAERAKGTP